jgi:hypothetical protein
MGKKLNYIETMRKLLAILLFTFITITIKAQSNDLIIGKWTFKDAFNKENIDQAGLEMLNAEVINKMTFDFNANGEFNAYMMGENQSGTWKLTNDTKKLILTASQEAPAEFEILKLTDKELALKLGLGEFLMVKISDKN